MKRRGIWASSLLLAMSALAGTEEAAWVSQGPPSLRLQISPQKHQVEVHLKSATPQTPRSLELVFRDETGRQTAVGLSAILPPREGEAEYRGSLIQSQRSYVGFELRIPLGKGRTQVLSSDRELRRETPAARKP